MSSNVQNAERKAPNRPMDFLNPRTALLKNTPNNAYISDIVNVRSLINIRPNHRERTVQTIDDERIILNVCGDRYETFRKTLERFPQSLLGNPRKRKSFFDPNRNEYFFDRNRSCFEAILYYYQSAGRLRRPNFVSLDIFLEEIHFFQLGEEALEQIRRDENLEEMEKVRLPKNRFRRYLWATMEYPEYSLLAKIVNSISLLMILLSSIALAVESLPQFVDLDDLYCQQDLNSSLNSTEEFYTCYLYFTSPFFLIQTICVGFFTIEFLLRLISTSSLWIFVKSPMNWIDLLAVVPYYVSLIVRLTGTQSNVNQSTYVGLRLLRILRFGRVFKFYRVFKRLKSFRVLVITIKQSLPDFLITITVLSLFAFLFGAAAYFAENGSNGVVFDSIPKATYWGVVTICSVGYGDMAPITVIGRIVACLCALSGASTIGVLVSVLVDRYQRVYARKLYVQDEPIDFNEHSDESSDENEFEERPIRPATISIDDDQNRLYFLLGYVIDEYEQIPNECFEEIEKVLRKKQTSDFQLNFQRIAVDSSLIDSNEVKFEIASTMSELFDDDEDIDDPFTEIAHGCHYRHNVLKTFHRKSSQPSRTSEEKEFYF